MSGHEFTPPTDEAMEAFATELLTYARTRARHYGMEQIGTSMALSCAAVKGLHALCVQLGKPEEAVPVVQSMNSTNLKAVADMVAGSNSHPVVQ